MVETIAPVVYGRTRDYRIAVALHALGAGIAGAAFGALLGLVGLALGGPWGDAGLVVIAAVALGYAARELTGLPLPLLDRKRQVPDWWRTFYSPWVAAMLYGAGLGIGYMTFLRFGTYVAVSVAALASGNPMLGAAFGGAFGLARGVTALAAARTTDADGAGLVVVRLETIAASRGPAIANGVMCVLLAGAALVRV